MSEWDSNDIRHQMPFCKFWGKMATAFASGIRLSSQREDERRLVRIKVSRLPVNLFHSGQDVFRDDN